MADAASRARLILGLRQAGITDARVLRAIESVPRELFVPEGVADSAYDDAVVPIAFGQVVGQPSVVARMTAALAPEARGRVLEIGTGAGYQTAVLARLCRRVYTVEPHREAAKAAQRRFDALDLSNITLRIGDGGMGWREQAPFERILVTAAVTVPPPPLLDQLAVGGWMVLAIDAGDGGQTIARVRRDREAYQRESLGAVRFLPLLADAADGAGR